MRKVLPPERKHRRHSPPILARARLLRWACRQQQPRLAILAPSGLALKWQIARDRRQVRARHCRTNRTYGLLRG